MGCERGIVGEEGWSERLCVGEGGQRGRDGDIKKER
jgi:hypothetical protein